MNSAQKHDKKSFFSVSFELLVTDVDLPYDLYVNSSASEFKDRFVRIFPKDVPLTKEDVAEYKKRFHQLYISEEQRDAYLKSLVNSDTLEPKEKAAIIKDSAITYLDNIFDSNKEFSTEVLEEAVEGCKESVSNMVAVVKDYSVDEMSSLIASLSFHDFYTYDHSINVSMYCIAIFKTLKPNATEEQLTMAGLGGLLHDLGKIKIPTNIINKPDGLSDTEFNIIKTHPDLGKNLLTENECGCHGVDMDILMRVIWEHHENFNGTGYPRGIAGDDIHLMARITAIADFFDAITTKRSYHEALTPEEAVGVMSKSVGKKLDPALFEVFKKTVIKKIDKKKQYRELPETFDPCQPQNTLPFVEKDVDYGYADPNAEKKKDESFTIKKKKAS